MNLKTKIIIINKKMRGNDEDISDIYPNHYLKMDYIEKKNCRWI